MKIVDINLIKPNPINPRFIKDTKLEDLKKSITDFEDMMKIRPIVVDEDFIILGGNMRYKAALSLGLQNIPIRKIEGLTDEEKKEFIIKDNIHAGLWDNEKLDTWEKEKIQEWGLYYDPTPIDKEFLDSHFLDNEEEGGYQKDTTEKKTITLTYDEETASLVKNTLLDNGDSIEEGLKTLLDL